MRITIPIAGCLGDVRSDVAVGAGLRSMGLNPDNTNGKAMLERSRGEMGR